MENKFLIVAVQHKEIVEQVKKVLQIDARCVIELPPVAVVLSSRGLLRASIVSSSCYFC